MNQLYTHIINSLPKDLKYRSDDAIRETYHFTIASLKETAMRSFITATTTSAKKNAKRIIDYIDYNATKPIPENRDELLKHFYSMILAIEKNDLMIGFGYHKYERTEEHHIRITSRNILNPERASLYQHHRELEIANEQHRQEMKETEMKIDTILAKQEAMRKRIAEIAF